MLRWLSVVLLLVMAAVAQTTGPPLNLNMPPHGSFPWDTQPNGGVNANWIAINNFAITGGGGGVFCVSNIQTGADLGAKINACDVLLGTTAGEIYASGGGAL